VDSTGERNMIGAAAAGRRRNFFLVLHRALPDLQRMSYQEEEKSLLSGVPGDIS